MPTWISLWISSMFFNLLSRIYSLKVLKLSDYGKARELMLVIDRAWNLVLIITVCHMTANQANRVGQLIFTPYSTVSMKHILSSDNIFSDSDINDGSLKK
ncbi:hypothetical protein E2986_11603 [Frieseomelitta varia]|uniref:Uncharacterized protein n=1 Tax=Frieseomelitta varia TaxID=561572 RepID=A0A833WAQ0_9HYME|nr:hypothetical protein E2986_11603 [Frieseomelitta varia]